MITFIDEQRGIYGAEPICRVLPIAPSTYHDHVAKRVDPAKLSARAQRDTAQKPEIITLMFGQQVVPLPDAVYAA